MKKNYLLLSSALILAFTGLKAQTITSFSYTGGMQTFTVPICVDSILVDVSGAQGGGDALDNAAGGMGGRVQAKIPVTAGQVLNIFVGGQGGLNTAGYNGGGAGFGGAVGTTAGGGGGASDIRIGGITLNDRVIVGGGGGGGVDNGGTATGGAGGGLIGGSPSPSADVWGCGIVEPTGGTQSAGGQGGTSTGCGWNGSNGTFGIGGDSYQNYRCAGGGGGWYGGGGGHNGCGGAGGSNYAYGSAAGVMHTQGYRAGDGVIILTYNIGPAGPAISGPSTLCQGSTVTYTASAVAGVTSYTWSVPAGTNIVSGQGTASIDIAAGNTSGNITVYAVTSCGNTATDTFPVTIDAVSNAGTASVTSTGVCPGDSSLSFSVNGATGSISWETSNDGGLTWNAIGAGSPYKPGVINPADSGTYIVHAIATNGTCAADTSNDLSVVIYPVSNAGTASVTSATVCSGSTVTLSSAGTSSGTLMWYSYNGTNYNYLGSGNPYSTAPLTASTYSFVAMLTSGTCAADTSNIKAVSVDAMPSAGTATSSVTGGNVCVGDAISFTAAGSTGSIQWLLRDTTTHTWISFGSGSPFNPGAPDPGDVGTYTLIAVASNGVCPSDTSAALYFNVQPLPVVNLGADTTFCSSITLDAGNAGSTYAWSSSQTTQTISVNATGQYIASVTSPYGCMSSDTIMVTITTITVTGSATSNSVCITASPISLSGSPAGGIWSGPGVSGSAFDPSVAGVGTYSLTYAYTDSAGCSNSDTIQMDVAGCAGIAGQPAIHALSLFPNPSNGTFVISAGNDLGNLLVEVVDMQGQRILVEEDKNLKSGFAKQITLDVAEGIYFVRITADGHRSIRKINVVK